MKVIISTKAYPKFIDKAIKKGFENFVIDGRNSHIVFYGYDLVSQTESIYPAIGYENEIFRAKLNHLQWYKLSEFLKQLPEQPIVLEFEEYADNTTEIKLSQFVHTI